MLYDIVKQYHLEEQVLVVTGDNLTTNDAALRYYASLLFENDSIYWDHIEGRGQYVLAIIHSLLPF